MIGFLSKTQNSNSIELFFSFSFLFLFFIFPDERYKEMSLIVDVSVVTSVYVYPLGTCRFDIYRPMYVQTNILFLFTMCNNMYVIM